MKDISTSLTTSLFESNLDISELLDCVYEYESFAQEFSENNPPGPLVEHAMRLCENYLKTMLDEHHVSSQLDHVKNHGSDLRSELVEIQGALKKFTERSKPQTDETRKFFSQSHYLHTSGGLIGEILRLCQQSGSLPKTFDQKFPYRSLLVDLDKIPQTPEDNSDSTNQSMSVERPPDTDETMQLSVYLFGEFRLGLNGHKITRQPRGKGLKIFKYLLVNYPTPIPKERLAKTFWPDIDSRARRNNLNVSIYYLRQELSRYHKSFQFVLYRDDHYLLNPDLSVWVDILAFDQAIHKGQRYLAKQNTSLAIEAYREAEALYAGDCMLDVDEEDWAQAISQAYRNRYLQVLDALASHLYDAAHYQECAELWQKAIALDNCDEKAHRNIMNCYLKVGQRQLALRQYHTCVESLKTELDLDPSPKTAALLDVIRQVD